MDFLNRPIDHAYRFASTYEKSGLLRHESMHAILSRFRVLCYFLGSSV